MPPTAVAETVALLEDLSRRAAELAAALPALDLGTATVYREARRLQNQAGDRPNCRVGINHQDVHHANLRFLNRNRLCPRIVHEQRKRADAVPGCSDDPSQPVKPACTTGNSGPFWTMRLGWTILVYLVVRW